jgi:hypothetical protein
MFAEQDLYGSASCDSATPVFREQIELGPLTSVKGMSSPELSPMISPTSRRHENA